MSDIFISYASEDREWLKRLVRQLEALGWSVWWDREALLTGVDFQQAIAKAIEDARLVVVVWSPASVKSQWVRDEAGEASELGKLVPILIGGARPPYGFRQAHTLDLGKWDGDGASADFQKLATDLRTRLGTGEKVAARPSVLFLVCRRIKALGDTWRRILLWIFALIVVLTLAWVLLYSGFDREIVVPPNPTQGDE